MIRRLDPRYAIALVAVVYAITLGLVEKRAFWITDNANKFLQLQAIVASGYADYSIPWPGARLDPEFEFNPLPPPFSHVEDGKLFSQYPPLFATVSSVPFRLLGYPGLYVLPLLFSLVALAGVSRIAAGLGMDARGKTLAVLLTGLCTPLWFYSVVFWEHTIALGLAVWAVHFHLRFARERAERSLVLGSLLAALSVYFRDDLLLLCAALLGFALYRAPGRRLRTAVVAAATLLAGVVPLWLFQWMAVGTPFGFHVAANLAGWSEHVATRPEVAYNLFAAASTSRWVSAALSAPFLAAWFFNPAFSERTFRFAFPVAAGLALIAAGLSLTGYFTSASPIAFMLKANSLFPAAPVILLGLVRSKDARRDGFDPQRSLWLIGLAYAILYALAAPAISSGGIHWGNRFLLLLYPVFALLAAANLRRWLDVVRPPDLRWLAVASVVLLSLAAQLYSIGLLQTKKDFTFRLNRQLRASPERVVITDVWWAPQALAAEFYERPIFFIRSPEDLRRLTDRLRSAGFESYVAVSRRPAGAGDVTVDDGGLHFFSLAFSPRSLNPPDARPAGGRGPS